MFTVAFILGRWIGFVILSLCMLIGAHMVYDYTGNKAGFIVAIVGILMMLIQV